MTSVALTGEVRCYCRICILSLSSKFHLVCPCLGLSVSSSSWSLGRAAVCDCGTPWTFLIPFL